MQRVIENDRRRILIVDDNRAIHDDFRKVLNRNEDASELEEAERAVFGLPKTSHISTDYEFGDAYQGQEGLVLVQQSIDEGRPYDLAFIDMRMPPGWDGIETIERCWQIDPDLHVVICTAYSDHPWGEIIDRFGCNDNLLILKKPFDNAEVAQLAAALTRKRQLLRDRRMYTEQLESRVRQQTSEIRRAHEETIHRLAEASMYRDEETGAHIRRVGLFSAVLAEAAGLSASEVEQIRMAAPMHDVGKIGIPDAILQKPGPLTDREREIMKSHTIIGAELLDGSESAMLRTASDIALHHHERWDGAGYPTEISGTSIPQAARIVAITDVYDALTHDRIYRPAFPREQALGMLEDGCGSQFDPELLHLFFEHLPEIESIAEKHPDSADKQESLIENKGANEWAIQPAELSVS